MMCEFCENLKCTLTKAQAIEHGAILEDNADSPMRDLSETDEGVKYTYSFTGVPAYYSLGAMVPDESEENPHAYMRYVFDEDTGCTGEWEGNEIMNPLQWQTEKEFLEKQGILQEVDK
jgi:hypothetical protein